MVVPVAVVLVAVAVGVATILHSNDVDDATKNDGCRQWILMLYILFDDVYVYEAIDQSDVMGNKHHCNNMIDAGLCSLIATVQR